MIRGDSSRRRWRSNRHPLFPTSLRAQRSNLRGGTLDCARNDGTEAAAFVPLVSRTRCSVKRCCAAGTQQVVRSADAWAPALQRITWCCVTSGAREPNLPRTAGPHDRRDLSFSQHHLPELCGRCRPQRMPRAQGRPGAGRAPTVHCAKGGNKNMHSGIQVEPNIPAFPAQWLERLMSCSPRGAMHYCPRRLADG